MSKRYLTDAEEEEIVKIYNSGYSTHQIANAYGLPTNSAIVGALKRHGVIRRAVHNLYAYKSNVFDLIDSEEKAYWLGFLYADGYVHHNVVQLILQIVDLEHLKKFIQFVNDGRVSEIFYRKNGTICGFKLHDVRMAKQLSEYGIVSGRRKDCSILSFVPTEYMRHFLRGYFDGDGCASKDQRAIFGGHIDLVEFIRSYMAQCVGTNPELAIHKNSRAEWYQIGFPRNKSAKMVGNYLYDNANVYLVRKKAMVDSWK